MRRSVAPGIYLTCSQQAIGKPAVPFEIRAHDLDVEGRGQSEIKDLAHEIGGKEIEEGSGKFRRQDCAQFRNVLGGRGVFLCEGNENVSIGWSNRSIVAIGGVRRAIGKADIIQDVDQLARQAQFPGFSFQ